MNRTDKEIEISTVIRDNPSLSGNEIYNKIKGTDLSIRKKTFYQIYRETKHIEKKPDTTIYVPKKYRKEKPKIKETFIEKEYPPTMVTNYQPFYEAVKTLVSRKGYPKNRHDLEYMMYNTGFRKKGRFKLYPTSRQTKLAWDYIKSN